MRTGRAKLLLFAVAWILLTPGALAGTESNPDVDDHLDKNSPSIDLLSAWFEPHPSGVKFTVKIAGTPSAPVDHLYYIMFQLEGQRHVVGIGLDKDNRVRSIAGPENFNGHNIEGPETFDSPLKQVKLERGTPTYASAVIPWSLLTGLEPGKVLVDLGAGTALYGRQSGSWSDSDLRVTENTFVLERVLVPREVSQALPLVLGILTIAGVSIVGTVLFLRKRSPREPAAAWPTAYEPAAPARIPVIEPPPPPPKSGAPHRFTLHPPSARKPPR